MLLASFIHDMHSSDEFTRYAPLASIPCNKWIKRIVTAGDVNYFRLQKRLVYIKPVTIILRKIGTGILNKAIKLCSITTWAHRILRTRKHVTPYTTNATGNMASYVYNWLHSRTTEIYWMDCYSIVLCVKVALLRHWKIVASQSSSQEE